MNQHFINSSDRVFKSNGYKPGRMGKAERAHRKVEMGTGCALCPSYFSNILFNSYS